MIDRVDLSQTEKAAPRLYGCSRVQRRRRAALRHIALPDHASAAGDPRGA